MKILIVLALAVAVNSANIVYHPAWGPSGSEYNTKDGQGNYAYGHHGGHPAGSSFHSESGNIAGTKVGSYGVRSPDGTVRIVDYVADHEGFKPKMRSWPSEQQTNGYNNGYNNNNGNNNAARSTQMKHPFPYNPPYYVTS